MQCTLLCTQGACILIRAKKSSAGRFFCPALHSIIYYSLYFLLPAHASALFSARPLLGFPAQSSVPQANPAFPIWSCGTQICLAGFRAKKIEPRPILVFKE